ncbi:MAG: hypothetical protein ACK55Z_38070, partial [bacterium]
MLRVSVSICCDCFALWNTKLLGSHLLTAPTDTCYFLFYPPSLLFLLKAAMTLEMPARKQVTPLGVSQTVPNALLVLTFQ